MFWVCCRRITSFCLLITIFFESLRFFCPTIPRYSSDTHKPLSARRSPQLPPHSGLLPMRPTPNEPTLGKGNVPYCSNNGAFSIALTHSCREWMGIELGEKIRAGERVSLLAKMARFLRQSVPLCAALFLSSAVGQVPDLGEHLERRIRRIFLDRCGECHGEKTQITGLKLTTARGFGLGHYGLSRIPCVT